jgi:hypothetical protein
MDNKQQTAVDWFSVKRDVLEIEVRLGKLSPIEYAEELTKAEQQAKEMEKDMLTDAYHDGKSNGMDISHSLSMTKEISADEWYNETYGGGEQ